MKFHPLTPVSFYYLIEYLLEQFFNGVNLSHNFHCIKILNMSSYTIPTFNSILINIKCWIINAKCMFSTSCMMKSGFWILVYFDISQLCNHLIQRKHNKHCHHNHKHSYFAFSLLSCVISSWIPNWSISFIYLLSLIIWVFLHIFVLFPQILIFLHSHHMPYPSRSLRF